MKSCPVCGTELKEVEKFGVQIDTCPRCRGVWLDRGELEKIMGLAREYTSGITREMDDDDHRHRYDEAHGRKKKRGFLNMFEEMFD